MKKRPSRFTALEPIGLVIQRDAGLRVPAAVETSPIAYRDWEAAVGSRIAARARPVRIDRGVLVVRTATATWAQELALLSDAILQQLRGRGIAVESLRFRVGPVEAPERPPTRDEVRRPPPAVALPAELRAELSHVEDPELRDAIARAAAKNLGWQATNATSKKTAPKRAPRRDEAPSTSAPSDARAPRSVERESAPQARTPAKARGAYRGKT